MPFPYPLPMFGVHVPVGFSFTPQFKALTTAATDVAYGSDISTFPALDASMKESDAPRLVGEALARRFITPRGKMTFHPDDGTDIRQYLNAPVIQQTLSRIKHDVEVEALQDERVSAPEAVVTYDSKTQRITLALQVELDDGPFRYTIAVDQLTSTLLAVQEA